MPANKRKAQEATVKSKREPKAPKEEKPFEKVERLYNTAGAAMTFGTGGMGQLGFDSDGRPFPTRVPCLANFPFVQAECGAMHTAFLRDNGQVYTVGVNDEGALGRPSEDDETIPEPMEGILKDIIVVQIACGDSHTLCLSEDGVVYSAGSYRCSQGKFGLTETLANSFEPIVVLDLGPKDCIVKILAGSSHSLALSRGGKVYSWGNHEMGVLGRLGDRISKRQLKHLCLTPTEVPFPKRKGGKVVNAIVDIGIGVNGCFAKAADNTIFAWGDNVNGQLALDDMEPKYGPEIVPLLQENSKLITAMQGGKRHSLFLKDGKVYSAGCGYEGVLGVGSEKSSFGEDEVNSLFEVKMPVDKVDDICANSMCSFAIADGSLYAWGFGDSMQLGNGKGAFEETESLDVPTKVGGKAIAERKITMVSCGAQHTALIGYPLKTESQLAAEAKKAAEEAK